MNYFQWTNYLPRSHRIDVRKFCRQTTSLFQKSRNIKCSNENMGDRSKWMQKSRNTKLRWSDVVQTDRSTERRSTGPENVENENFMSHHKQGKG